jgi:hypothetical protein
MADHLTALMFDEALIRFGVWAENRLVEGDSLAEILDDEIMMELEAAISRLEAIPGFVSRRKSSVGLQVDENAN